MTKEAELKEEFLKYIKAETEEELKEAIRDIISRYGRATNMGGYSLDFLTGQMYIYFYTMFVEFRNEYHKIVKKRLESELEWLKGFGRTFKKKYDTANYINTRIKKIKQELNQEKEK